MPAPTRQPQTTGNLWPVYLIVSGYLILRFAAAIFMRGGEWPLPPSHYLQMAVDAGLLVGVIGLRSQLSARLDRHDPRRGLMGVLLVVGVIAGVSLLLIRFTSDAAWWTGYLRN
jgi:MFS-type transporter involved in bile tolerance (Atg22 family)